MMALFWVSRPFKHLFLWCSLCKLRFIAIERGHKFKTWQSPCANISLAPGATLRRWSQHPVCTAASDDNLQEFDQLCSSWTINHHLVLLRTLDAVPVDLKDLALKEKENHLRNKLTVNRLYAK